jgi:hypothetical protein
LSSKSVRQVDAVLKGSHQIVPGHGVDDVIDVGKDNDTDPEVDLVLPLDYYIRVSLYFLNLFSSLNFWLLVLLSFLYFYFIIIIFVSGSYSYADSPIF